MFTDSVYFKKKSYDEKLLLMNLYKKTIVVLLACLFLSSGCSTLKTNNKSKWRPVSQKKRVVVHKVQWPEETFEMISVWYTGKKGNVEKVVDANPALNPEKLNSGDSLYIPGNLLRTRKEMERRFVDSYLKKNAVKKKKIRKPVKTKKQPETDNNAFELFGPR